ncbi:Ferric iron reductase FhuF-like transporter [Micromonospora haikouensis]|uniref:Ferric iron reductase FhuF-like transporter n=1 Tax=Micromonospora haikouensis TaxID=686309 RepID=A0A1C4V5K5_9ACTN|nr:Ferric iron reductase FhuF-like transporter [Micromonospora haikouensis]
MGGDAEAAGTRRAAHALGPMTTVNDTFTCTADTGADALYRAELGDDTFAGFAATLTGLGLDPADYLYLPVHPWQWWNRLAVTFAADVAEQRLVCLGPGPEEHLAQQSVRTFFNVTHPQRHYVKTALSVLNMGFVRGLSAAYMEATPAINDWLADLIDRDEVLASTGLTILRERAAIGYRNRRFEAATDRYSPYRKMLAALWRESPVPGLEPGRRLATMASLLHVDSAGGSFAAALVAESGLPAPVWLRRYLDAGLLSEEEFWRTVADCAADYAARVPHLADRLARHDLFAPEFAHSCLNRLQLRDNQQMVDLSDPSAALQFAGTLANPIAPYARRA